MQSRAVAILLAVTALVVAACGAGTPSTTSTAGGPMVIRDAWVRAAPAGGTSAAYMTLTNGRVAADALVGVSAPDLTDAASIHETTSDASGMTGMHMTESITLPSGTAVALQPGGFHIMLENLKQELKAGDQVQLTLTFEQAGVVNVTAEVRAN